MSSLILSGDTSGTVTVTVPAVAGTNTATLPAATGTVMVSGNMPAFSVYQATQQTGISATVTTKITFDTKIFDTNNNFTSSRFTATIPGYYEISAGVGLQNASSTAYGQLTIYKNGAALINGAASVGITGALYPQSLGVTTVYLSVNDYVEIYFYCSGGGTVAVLNATYFQGVLVRAA